LGNNFRNTDINAFIGLLDLNRAEKYRDRRMELYGLYQNNLDPNKFLLPKDYKNRTHVPFSLPVICKNQTTKQRIIKYCEDKKIETRPIISGNLLRQTCLQKFGRYQDYPNSELLNNNGLYIGLYSQLKNQSIIGFTKELNSLT
jgi:CDP-6-deoxy-D-xylo-4-hexulose-3-dehydrase